MRCFCASESFSSCHSESGTSGRAEISVTTTFLQTVSIANPRDTRDSDFPSVAILGKGKSSVGVRKACFIGTGAFPMIWSMVPRFTEDSEEMEEEEEEEDVGAITVLRSKWAEGGAVEVYDK